MEFSRSFFVKPDGLTGDGFFAEFFLSSLVGLPEMEFSRSFFYIAPDGLCLVLYPELLNGISKNFKSL
jgi:hypothetical protein